MTRSQNSTFFPTGLGSPLPTKTKFKPSIFLLASRTRLSPFLSEKDPTKQAIVAFCGNPYFFLDSNLLRGLKIVWSTPLGNTLILFGSIKDKLISSFLFFSETEITPEQFLKADKS